MKISGILACLACAAAASLILEPWSETRASPYSFEVNVASEESGLVQLYFDSGGGMSEANSSIRPIISGESRLLRFKLPFGQIRALRFDPLDSYARMTVSEARIVDRSGATLVSFAPGQFKAMNQIASLRVDGETLRIETTPGGLDPQLSISLAGPISIPRPFWWREILVIFAILLAGLFLVRIAGPPVWGALRGEPGRAIAIAAVLGTAAANFPVIFAGKSVMAPGFGVALLYGQNPWVPGYQSADISDNDKSDVGAVMWQNLPYSAVEARAVFHDGEIPLWNRYDSAGVPLLGQGQSCLGDPLNIIAMLAHGAGWAWDMKILLAKVIFAWGVGLCAWSMFRHLPSALLITCSAPFIGFFVYRINHPAIFSMCYSPWIVYCWVRAIEGRAALDTAPWLAAWVGANWVEVNSGTVKEAYLLLLLMNLAGLCILLASKRSIRAKAALLGGFVVAGTAFAMMSSPMWLTFLRTLRGSYTGYSKPSALQLQPGMLAGLFDEAFYRPFQVESGVINPSANFLILLGLLWAIVRWRSLMADRFAAGLAISSVPMLAVAFGVIPPSIITRIPFLGNILHIDNTFSCGVIVVFILLAGFGWREAWERLASGAGRKEGAAVLALLILVLAVCLGTAQSAMRGAYGERTWGSLIKVGPFIYYYALSLAGGAALLTWAIGKIRRGMPAADAMLAFSVLGFAALHWRMGEQLGTAYPEYVVRPPDRVDLTARSAAVEGILSAGGDPFRVVGLDDSFLPGWSGVYGIEGISGPDALVNRYYREFLDTYGIARVWDWRYIVGMADFPKYRPILDLLNVRYYLGYYEDRARAGERLKLVRSADMDAFESGSSWPRAFFTDSVAVYGDLAQYCSWIKAGDGRPFAAIAHSDWMNLHPMPRVSGNLATRTVNSATDYALTANSTSFTVTATGPGFIVLSEAYEEGNFRVSVNGRDAPYLRINQAFKGVYVDSAGTYLIRFTYWPAGFSRTLEMSAAGLGILVVGLLLAFMRRGPRTHAPVGAASPGRA
jgi:hypothetical protein